MRSNTLSPAATFTATTRLSRDAIRRAAPLYTRALQALRQRVRTKRDLTIAVTAALALTGVIAGLIAALTSGTAGTGAAGTATASLTAAHQQASNDATAATTQPYQMYDSTTVSAIPAGHPVATYATGSYAGSPAQVSGKQVIWIDTNGTDPANASVLDIEPGNVAPSAAATWTQARLTANPRTVARIYTMLSEWPAAKAAIATLPAWMQSHVRWWIADPTGIQHVVPGSSATQWYWGPSYDISTVNPGF